MVRLKKILVLVMMVNFLMASSIWADGQKKDTMNFLVTWTVINTWIIPCYSEPTKFIDEYGRKSISYASTLELCHDFEILYKEKEFAIYEEAKAFIDNAKKTCEQIYDCEIQNFKIKEIK